MAEVLSQNEIESLLASMTVAEEEPPVSAATEQRRAALEAVPASAPPIRTVEGRIFLPLHKRRRAAASRALAVHAVPVPVNRAPLTSRTISGVPTSFPKNTCGRLQMLHETFAGYFGSSLAGYLRAQAQVELVSVEQVPYDEYMKSISASLLNILNVDALSGQAIFEMDFGILFSMLDRLLGGKGAAGKVVRDLTDIEKVLARQCD